MGKQIGKEMRKSFFALAGILVAALIAAIWLWPRDRRREDTNGPSFRPSKFIVLMGAVGRTKALATRIHSIALSRDNKLLVSSGDSNLRTPPCLWDLSTGNRVRTFSGPDDVISLSFNSNSNWLAIGGVDAATLHVVRTGDRLREFPGARGLVCFSEDGKMFVTAAHDHAALLWNSETGERIGKFPVSNGPVVDAAFSKDGRWLATGGFDKSARLWEVTTGKLIRVFRGHSDIVCSVAVLTDGNQLLTASNDGTCRLWNTTTGKTIREFRGHSARIDSAIVSMDQRILLTAGADNTARLWDLETGNETQVFHHGGGVNCLALTSDNGILVTSSVERVIRLWKTATGEEICRIITFDDDTWVVFDSEGRFDGSREGNIPSLKCLVNNKVYPLSHAKEGYYQPGLLARHMGFNQQPLRKVDRIEVVLYALGEYP
jgi:WD40 repeat protein